MEVNRDLMKAIEQSESKPDSLNDLFWFKAVKVSEVPQNGGVCVKYKDMQVALFSFNRKQKWYACQNLCPHKMEMVLSRGMLGDLQGIPKVACPLHKNNFSLETGEHLNGDLPTIKVFPVKVEDDQVFIGFENKDRL